MIFKIINDRKFEEKTQYSNIIVNSFTLNEIFETNSLQKYNLEIIIVRLGNEFKYFFIQESRVFFSSGEFFDIDQALKKIQLENMIICGLIYAISFEKPFRTIELERKSIQNNKIQKINEDICKCGKRCIIGEALCDNCLEKERKKTIQEISYAERVIKSPKKCTCKNIRNTITDKCLVCRSKSKEINKKLKKEGENNIEINTKGYKERNSYSLQIKSITQKCAHCGKIKHSGICKEINTIEYCKGCKDIMVNGICPFCIIEAKECVVCSIKVSNSF